MDFSKYGYKHAANCESCEFYVYDEYTDSYCCNLNLDEDETARYLSGVRTTAFTTNIKAFISKFKAKSTATAVLFILYIIFTILSKNICSFLTLLFISKIKSKPHSSYYHREMKRC